MSDGDDRDRPQMTGDDASDSHAFTGVTSRSTEHLSHVARISYLSQDRPDLKFASMQVCCAMASPSVLDVDRIKRKRIGRYFDGKPRAVCLFRWQKV